ncbi:Hypp4745 [Branchiostoma lanceolatum]|uniref:Hypp4745 protein n=1 Tax=Branchiostoma lanceolatum TaxID=7740 RepID=A0A8K0EZQ5_BRALA|nr:Hypp4745 [Branchiostoma lanceolatum]
MDIKSVAVRWIYHGRTRSDSTLSALLLAVLISHHVATIAGYELPDAGFEELSSEIVICSRTNNRLPPPVRVPSCFPAVLWVGEEGVLVSCQRYGPGVVAPGRGQSPDPAGPLSYS